MVAVFSVPCDNSEFFTQAPFNFQQKRRVFPEEWVFPLEFFSTMRLIGNIFMKKIRLLKIKFGFVRFSKEENTFTSLMPDIFDSSQLPRD